MDRRMLVRMDTCWVLQCKFFQLKIPNKMPKYPTRASNLLDTFLDTNGLNGKYQIHVYPKMPIHELGQMDTQSETIIHYHVAGYKN